MQVGGVSAYGERACVFSSARMVSPEACARRSSSSDEDSSHTHARLLRALVRWTPQEELSDDECSEHEALSDEDIEEEQNAVLWLLVSMVAGFGYYGFGCLFFTPFARSFLYYAVV